MRTVRQFDNEGFPGADKAAYNHCQAHDRRDAKRVASIMPKLDVSGMPAEQRAEYRQKKFSPGD